MTNTNKIKIMKPQCKVCGYTPVETQDRICPRDKSIMKLEIVEIEVE